MITRSIDPLQDREGWLRERETGIGASEAGAACGVDPYRTPLTLWATKTRRIPPQPETEAMRLGLLLEPVIARIYEERNGRAIEQAQVFERSGERPHLFATLDGIDSQGDLVEIKTIGSLKAESSLGEEGTDELPDTWLCQAQQQLYVTGREIVHFAVLIGGQRFARYEVRRRPDLLDAMLPALDRFWGCVKADREPALAPDPRDNEIRAAIHRPTGEIFSADADLALNVLTYEELGRRISETGACRESIKAKIVAALQGRTALLPDDRTIAYVERRRSGYTVEPSTYHQLSIRKGG